MLREPEKLNKHATSNVRPSIDAHSRLVREWWMFAVVGVLGVGLGGWMLALVWGNVFALRWVGLAALVTAFEVYVLRRGLGKNHRAGESHLLSTLGLGNWLSLLRGLMLAYIAGFLFSPWPDGWLAWAPGVLYSAAGLIDLVDGYAARVTHHTTALGAYLDMELDALGILIAPLLGVWYGQLPIWYLLASAARYLFVAGMWWRTRKGLPNQDLAHSDLRRVLASFQMGFIGVVLLPIFSPPATWIAAAAFIMPFLVVFVRDWFLVTGELNPDSTRYRAAALRAEQFFLHWLPALLRVVVLVLSLLLAGSYLRSTGGDVVALGALFSMIGIIVGAGIAARLLSVVLLLVVGLTQPIESPGTVLLIISLSLIFLLGSGALSIWRPEERVLRGRFGEKARSDYHQG